LLYPSTLLSPHYSPTLPTRRSSELIAYTDTDAQAESRAIRTVHLTAENYQLNPSTTDTTIHCTNNPCSTSGTQITVNVSIDVPLPLIPTFLGNQTRIATMDATGYHVIGEFE